MKTITQLEDEVAHLRFVVECKDGEIQHLKTQLGLVPTVGIFRRLWELVCEITESQATKVRRMT